MNSNTEQSLIERLSKIVEEERTILGGLASLRFDERIIGLPQFSETQIDGFKSIVDTHAGLVEGLQKKLSSPHLATPSLEEIRDVTRKIIESYGECPKDDEGQATYTPNDAVMATLLAVRKAGRATIERLERSVADMHEQTKQLIGASDPDFDEMERARNARIGFHEATLAAINRVWNEEPGISAQRMWGCLGEAVAIRHNLLELQGQRWWNEAAPQRARE